METVKEKIIKIVTHQPDDSSYDEILHELAFARMVERGIKDMNDGKLKSNEAIKNKIDKWRT